MILLKQEKTSKGILLKGAFIPKLINNPLASSCLIYFCIYYHTLHILIKALFVRFLFLQLLDFYFLYFFYTSSNKITCFTKSVQHNSKLNKRFQVSYSLIHSNLFLQLNNFLLYFSFKSEFLIHAFFRHDYAFSDTLQWY